MTHDRSVGDDMLFAELEAELSGDTSAPARPAAPMSASPKSSTDDPLAELARLIEESRGKQPAEPVLPPKAAAPAPAPAPAPRMESTRPQPAPQSYDDDLTRDLEASLRDMDFSSDFDPFAQPGDMSSDMTQRGGQPAPQPAPKPAAQPKIAARPAPAPEPEFDEDDPFASLESALSRVVAAEAAPTASSAKKAYAQPAPAADLYYDAGQHQDQHGGAHDYGEALEPGIQYDDGAPEFTDEDDSMSPYEEDGYDYDEAPPSRRGVYVVGALMGLVVVGGAVAFGLKSFSGGNDGNVPLVQASGEPVKSQPDQAAQPASGQQGKLVYDRIGGNSDDPADSQIVPREEQVAVGADGRPIRVISGNGAPPVPSTEGDGEDLRRVRTLTVRPDGQIETPPPPPEPVMQQSMQQPRQDAESAGGNDVTVAFPAPPAPRQAPSQVATANAQPSQLDVVRQNAQAQAQSQGVPLPLTRPSSNEVQQQDQTPVAVAPVQIPQAPVVSAPQPRSSASPFGRNNDAAAIVISRASDQAPTAPAPAPVQTTAPPASVPVAVAPQATQTQASASSASQSASSIASGYVVQVASSRSESDAQSALSRVQGQAGGALGSYRGQVQKADLGSRGVFYRAAFGPMPSMSEATSVCNRLKSNGIDCFVR